MKRRQHLLEYFRREPVDAILISKPENIRYFSHFVGSFGYLLFIDDEHVYLLTDGRYDQQANETAHDVEVMTIADADALPAVFDNFGIRNLAIESLHVSYAEATFWLSKSHLQAVWPVDEVVASARICKDQNEIRAIETACDIASNAFLAMQQDIESNMTEIAVNNMLQDKILADVRVEMTMPRFIVASGERGALPHGIASNRRIKEGDLVTVDFGCRVDGYWSDLTRTICVGEKSHWQRELYDAVKAAQLEAINMLQPGVTGRMVDAAARRVLEDAGYGDYFIHGTGHGLGLDIHEQPVLKDTDAGESVLQEGMIITIEPGIYLPGKGGVRIEDDVLITAEGYRLLSNSSESLICTGD